MNHLRSWYLPVTNDYDTKESSVFEFMSKALKRLAEEKYIAAYDKSVKPEHIEYLTIDTTDEEYIDHKGIEKYLAK